MTTVEHNFSVEEEEQAKNLASTLNGPIRIVDRLEKRNQNLFKKMILAAYPWNSKEYSHIDRFRLCKKIQILSFDVNDIIKNLRFSTRKIAQTDEFFLKRVNMDWEPHISKGSPGQTSIFLCDFRCKKFENIFKGGYVFNTSDAIQGLCCSPGYMISLQDPNLHKIFKFMVVTVGLDLDDDSFYGRLTLGLDFTIGTSLRSSKDSCDVLTLVTNKKATPIGNRVAGPLDDITEEISLEQMVQSLRTANFSSSSSSSSLQITPENLNKFLNRSLSLSSSHVGQPMLTPGRESCSRVLDDKPVKPIDSCSPFFKPVKPRQALASSSTARVGLPCDNQPHLFSACPNFPAHLTARKSVNEFESVDAAPN